MKFDHKCPSYCALAHPAIWDAKLARGAMLTSVLATPVMVVARGEKQDEEEKFRKASGAIISAPIPPPTPSFSDRVLGQSRPSPCRQHLPRLVSLRVALLYLLCSIFFFSGGKQCAIRFETFDVLG